MTVFLTACGGGGNNSSVVAPPALAPTFTNTPTPNAAEGMTYTYQVGATDPSGGTVTLKLTAAPDGATLSGNTVTWTPTATQSRVANQFTLTATTSEGASAKQSWTVTPDGTVRVSWVDTYWSDDGGTNQVYPWGALQGGVVALVPQTDGSVKQFQGSIGSDGTVTIANVPAGYYWLRIGTATYYWTNTSAFDFGSDYTTQSRPTLNNPTMTTNFSFSVSGMQKVDPTWVYFQSRFWDLPNPQNISFLQASGYYDYSKDKTGYVLQYVPATFGTMQGSVLGPAATLTNMGWTNGSTNNITAALTPSPITSLNLSIKGSAWAPLFDHVAPAAVTPVASPFNLAVQPYATNGIARQAWLLTLFSPLGLVTNEFMGPSLASARFCGSETSSLTTNARQPVLLTDQDLGTIQYGDPFPSEWTRVFSICQQASVQVPFPGLSQTPTFTVTNGQMTAPPSAAVEPIISPVQNPTINGADFFTAATVNSPAITISWSKPATGNPFGYQVSVMQPSGSMIFNLAGLNTSKTSLTFPPNVLKPGNTYVFMITAQADAKANIETSPNRTKLPVGNADVVSAAITVSGATQ